MIAVRRSVSLSMDSRKSSRTSSGQSTSGCRMLDTEALIEARGDRRSCDTARQHGGAELVRARQCVCLRRHLAQALLLERTGQLRRERTQDAVVVGIERLAAGGQHGAHRQRDTTSASSGVVGAVPAAARACHDLPSSVVNTATPSKPKVSRMRSTRSAGWSSSPDPLSDARVDASRRARAASLARRADTETKNDTIAATETKTNSSMMLSRSLTRNVWYGGIRNQFATSGLSTAAPRPGNAPPRALTPTTRSR